jgi:hypothetical protein
MTEEQRTLLARRLRAAIEQQHEIEALRMLLLKRGGSELVAPPSSDPDLPALIERGFIMPGAATCEEIESSACHENVARLWLDKSHGLSCIGTGYALSEDGLWRQHSWGIREDAIVETTVRRLKYFGIVLHGDVADAFARNNTDAQQ